MSGTLTSGCCWCSTTSCSPLRYGSGRSSTPLTTEKMAVFAPMPRAMVAITTSANPRLRRRLRMPYLTSWTNVSTRRDNHVSRTSSLTRSTAPKARSAAARAASGLMPARILCSVSMSMWNRSSASSSRSTRRVRNTVERRVCRRRTMGASR